MIKYGIYYFLRLYVQIGLFFFYKKVEVHGKSNIPKNQPVLFLPNHQNAFIDALLLVANNGCVTHFVARADIFKRRFLKWLLSLINLMPIYRMRDGWQSLGKNEAVFAACHRVFDKQEALMMFPEGNHNIKRRLRSLSKGFTRVIFGSLAMAPEKEIYIVPVGINYTDHFSYRSSVSIYFDKPLLASNYYKDGGSAKEANTLREDVSARLKQIITHVEAEDHYHETIKQLEALQPNYLDPVQTNQQLQKLKLEKVDSLAEENNAAYNLVARPLAYLNGTFIILLWKSIEGLIKDSAFIASFKFCYGITIVPLILILQASLVYLTVGGIWAIGYFIVSILLMPFLARKT